MWRARSPRRFTGVGFAKLPYTCGGRIPDPPTRSDVIEVEGSTL